MGKKEESSKRKIRQRKEASEVLLDKRIMGKEEGSLKGKIIEREEASEVLLHKRVQCRPVLFRGYQNFGDGVEENVVTPVIYEDEDESDDEGSEDSMEVDTVEDGEEPAVCSDISDDKDNGEISD